MNIENKYPVTIFKNENGKYVVGISNKKQDGSYENAYFPIQFNKEVELENKTKIYMKNAWLTFYKWEFEEKKGTTFYIKCSQFDLVEDKQEEDPYANFGTTIEAEQLDDGMDLPF